MAYRVVGFTIRPAHSMSVAETLEIMDRTVAADKEIHAQEYVAS